MNSNYYKNMPEESQLAAVSQNPAFIKYLYKPSEKVQIEAVKNIDYSSEQIDMWDYKYSHKYYISRYITSTKAIELYDKLKKVGKIIL